MHRAAISAKNHSAISQAFEFLGRLLCVHLQMTRECLVRQVLDFLEQAGRSQYSLKSCNICPTSWWPRKGILSGSEAKHYFHLIEMLDDRTHHQGGYAVKPMLQNLDYLLLAWLQEGQSHIVAGYTAAFTCRHPERPAPCRA